jgi:hypothetical protein
MKMKKWIEYAIAGVILALLLAFCLHLLRWHVWVLREVCFDLRFMHFEFAVQYPLLHAICRGGDFLYRFHVVPLFALVAFAAGAVCAPRMSPDRRLRARRIVLSSVVAIVVCITGTLVWLILDAYSDASATASQAATARHRQIDEKMDGHNKTLDATSQ